MGNGSWTSLGTGTSGTITLEQLTPNTQYTVYFKGVSTPALDSLSSNEVNTSATTIDMARITKIDNCIFGNSISFTVSNPSGSPAKLKLWTTGNSNKPEFEMNVVNGTNTFTPTQLQLDNMYKCFTNSNTIPMYFLVTTTGNWSNWTDTQQSKNLQLTGIAKTAHLGINNKPKRSQVFIGVNGIPKRAIMWIGDENNKPRRCI